MYRLSITTWLLISLIPFVASGQKGGALKETCEVWRKSVWRKVYLRNDHSQQDQAFFKNLIKDVNRGKLRAYLFDEDRADAALTLDEQKKIATLLTDSTFGYHTYSEASLKHVTSYDIREDWTYLPSSGQTTIEISGVAPSVDIYGDDGNFRGTVAVFWLKWKDIIALTDNSQIQSPSNLATLIWQDYFRDSFLSTGTFNGGQGGATFVGASVQRQIELSTEDNTYDRSKNIPERWPDYPLGELLCRGFLSGSISAFESDTLSASTRLSYSRLREITAPKADTLDSTMIDGLDPNTIKIVSRDFDYRTIRKYSIKEEWKFDIAAGKTEIKNLAVGLYEDEYGKDRNYVGNKLLLWCGYDAVADILRKYREYHHENNIDWLLWNSRFTEPTRRRKID